MEKVSTERANSEISNDALKQLKQRLRQQHFKRRGSDQSIQHSTPPLLSTPPLIPTPPLLPTAPHSATTSRSFTSTNHTHDSHPPPPTSTNHTHYSHPPPPTSTNHTHYSHPPPPTSTNHTHYSHPPPPTSTNHIHDPPPYSEVPYVEEVTSDGDSDNSEERRRKIIDHMKEFGVETVFDPNKTVNQPFQSQKIKYSLDVEYASLTTDEELREFVTTPVPPNDEFMECKIVRDRSGVKKLAPKYLLQIEKKNEEKPVNLLVGWKSIVNKPYNYVIELRSVGQNNTAVACLKSNFIGSEFTGSALKRANSESSHNEDRLDDNMIIRYGSLSSKTKMPRKMEVDVSLKSCKNIKFEKDKISLVNKEPRWNDSAGAYVLNFCKRVTVVSSIIVTVS
eukprot:GHVL01020473.1.p1 GENE.GHVL01020473.1~~GHVL01020473.1.p1  ORF type:complete len:393 (+),score=78.30 GHVL01020473.1:12-1190(+)